MRRILRLNGIILSNLLQALNVALTMMFDIILATVTLPNNENEWS